MNVARAFSSPARTGPALRRHRVAATLAAVFGVFGGLAAAPPAAAVQAEYSTLLALGRAAYERRDFPTAIRDFRLACFGMLDEPKALADCLARLALAQDKASDLDGLQQTFQRLSEIEEKFSAYRQGDLAPDLRAALEPRLQARIPAATLENSVGFRFLATGKKPDSADKGSAGTDVPERGRERSASPPKATAPGKKAPTASGKEAEVPKAQGQTAASSKPPQEPPVSGAGPAGSAGLPGSNPAAPTMAPPAAPTAANPAVAPPSANPTPLTPPGSSGAGTSPAPAPAPPLAARPLTDLERDTLQQAREKLAIEQSARELRSVFEATKTVADAHPESREAQHLVGQSAYRLSRWNEAIAYFKRGGDPGDEQSELLFYVAVSLFESGDTAGAALALKRALPNLRRTDYVDKYAKKILGQ